VTNALNHLVIKMEPCQGKVDKKGSKIQTDVIMLQKASGGYIHLMEGIEKKGNESERRVWRSY